MIALSLPVLPPAAECAVRMGKHLTEEEVASLENMARRKGAKPPDIIKAFNQARRRKKRPSASESAVRRVLAGEAYQRGKVERRGRPTKATTAVVHRYEKSRVKIAKRVKSEFRVTHAMVMADAKLTGRVSTRRLQPAVQKLENVSFRPAREKPERTEEEEKKRFDKSGTWQHRPASFWTEEIHGYIDNKTFAVPINAQKATLLKRQKVYGHLRKPCEGTQPEFVRPKKQRKGIGVPAVEMTACVAPAKGRIIMFHRPKKKWCAKEAKYMYEHPLKAALERTYGELPSYRIVEDGDPSGYQTAAGREGKKAAKIHSWKLPPRTPEWMPLDYSIWAKIEAKALKSVKGRQTKDTWATVLRKAAQGLSPAYITKTCASMKKRIVATHKAKGAHIDID